MSGAAKTPKTGFADLDEFFTGELELPWRGTTYVIPAPDFKLGAYMQAAVAVAVDAATSRDPDAHDVEVLTDTQERDVFAKLLGPVREQLVDAGANWAVVRRFGLTAFLYYTVGEDAAMDAWQGKAPPAGSRAQRRAEIVKGSRRGSSGTGRKTRSPGSTAGTTSTKPRKRG